MAMDKVDASKFSFEYSYSCYRHIFISCKSSEVVRAHYTSITDCRDKGTSHQSLKRTISRSKNNKFIQAEFLQISADTQLHVKFRLRRYFQIIRSIFPAKNFHLIKGTVIYLGSGFLKGKIVVFSK